MSNPGPGTLRAQGSGAKKSPLGLDVVEALALGSVRDGTGA